jgi:acyl-CoA hydrolase
MLGHDAQPRGDYLGAHLPHGRPRREPGWQRPRRLGDEAVCDDVAVIAATRLAGGRVVTAAVDAMKFRAPVKVGDVITLRATVNATWRTSMEVGVRVDAEHVPTGDVTHTCTAYLTMVALGEDEKPVLLPALEPETPEDERRRRDAGHRREVRLAAPGELRRVTP